MYWVLSNLYGQEMLQKLPLNSFKCKKDKFRFDEKLIGNYNENSDKGYILEAEVKHPKELHEQQSEQSFLPISKIEKCEKLVCNLYKNNACKIPQTGNE